MKNWFQLQLARLRPFCNSPWKNENRDDSDTGDKAEGALHGHTDSACRGAWYRHHRVLLWPTVTYAENRNAHSQAGKTTIMASSGGMFGQTNANQSLVGVLRVGPCCCCSLGYSIAYVYTYSGQEDACMSSHVSCFFDRVAEGVTRSAFYSSGSSKGL